MDKKKFSSAKTLDSQKYKESIRNFSGDLVPHPYDH